MIIPKPSEWKARENAFTRSSSGWDERLDGQEGVSGVCDFKGKRFLYYVGASGNRPDGGPANRTLGVAISTDGGLRFKKRKQPILRHQPHGNVEEGIFSAKPLVSKDRQTLWLYVGVIESRSQHSTSVDVFVNLYRSCDGEALTFVKRVWWTGKEAWPMAATWVGGVVHLWVGKHTAKLLRGPRPDVVGKAIDAKIPVGSGHGAVALGGKIALLCDRPTKALMTTRKAPTKWKVAATYPALKEGDIGKTWTVTPAEWAAYLLAPDGKSVKVWTAKTRTT